MYSDHTTVPEPRIGSLEPGSTKENSIVLPLGHCRPV